MVSARPMTDIVEARATARSVFLILLAVFTATMCGLPDNTDSECEFQTTSALARTGWFALGGTPEGDAMAASPGLAPIRIGTDGEAYSWFGIGQAMFAVPLYAAGAAAGKVFSGVEERHAATTYYGVPRSEYFAHLAVGWRNPLLTALVAWMLVKVLIELGASRRAAWLGGVSYGLASYAWPQARSTLSDVQAGFFLFAAFALLLAARRRVKDEGKPRAVELALLGAALGGAFLTRSLTAPALAVMGLGAVAVALPLWKRGETQQVVKAVALVAAPALACIAFYLWTNVERFGDALESGYGEPLSTGLFFNHPIHQGLAGLLISPGKGLVFLAPLVLLAPLGAMRSWRAGERLFPLILLGVLLTVFLPVAKMAGWHGAWNYGPRYVLPALPFLWIGTWLAFDRAGPRLRLAFGGLAAAGVVTALPGVLVDMQTHHELAIEGARLAMEHEIDPALPAESREEILFQAVQWEWRFAAPWAHWRILRYRLARPDETPEGVFPARELFFVDTDAQLAVSHDRQRGWRHFAWVDLSQRLNGPGWVGALLALGLLVVGVAGARAATRPD